MRKNMMKERKERRQDVGEEKESDLPCSIDSAKVPVPFRSRFRRHPSYGFHDTD